MSPRALELDDRLAEAHASRAHLLVYEWDWRETEREFKRAIELNPGYAAARHWYANYLTLMRRHGEAIAQARRAVELEPLSLSVNAGALGNAYLQAGRVDEAIEQLRKVLELNPGFGGARHALGLAYARKGMYVEALTQMQLAAQLGERKTWTAHVGALRAAMGQKDEARKILAELEAGPEGVSPVALASLCVAVGRVDQAFKWLEEGYERRDADFPSLNIEPGLKPLRADPRFQDLLRRAGLTH